MITFYFNAIIYWNEGVKMYQALYRKYRPENLQDVVGQKIVINTLQNAIKNNKISHAYLFTGPRGTGKTSIAKAFAKIINCEKLSNIKPCNICVSCTKTNLKQNTDIIEIDAASNNGVDEIREIRNKVTLVPTYGKYKVYIIDEVHMLTVGAFNALLKTLEEPPSHVIFILATTEPHKIPETILSRCQRFDFKKISIENIVERLKYICESEKIDIKEDALIEIANLSDGGMRDSISLLDQVSSYVDTNTTISIDEVDEVSGILNYNKMIDFMKSILSCDLEKTLMLLKKYDSCGINIKKVVEQLIISFENIILSKVTPKYFKEKVINEKMYQELPVVNYEVVLDIIDILNNDLFKISNSLNQNLMFELTLIKINEKLKKYNINLEIEKTNNHYISDDSVTTYDEASYVYEVHKNKKIEENLNYKIKSYENYQKFKNQRIENTLSKFDKSQISLIKSSLEHLKNYIIDPVYGKYISMFLDGQVKATSEESFIIVFDDKATSEIFNTNIPILEQILIKFLNNNKLVISTYLEEWNKIKQEFNSKQKQYIYNYDIISEDSVYENLSNISNDIQDVFEDCIEYI